MELAACLCSPGFVGELAAPEDTCTACGRAQYKAGNGPGPCANCPGNSDTSGTGHTEALACVCDAGFERGPAASATEPCTEIIDSAETVALIAAASIGGIGVLGAAGYFLNGALSGGGGGSHWTGYRAEASEPFLPDGSS